VGKIATVEAYNNGINGIFVSGAMNGGTINASVTDSVAANNAGVGFLVASTTTTPAGLMVVRSLAANNGTGLSAQGANATLRLTQSTVTGNTTSWSAPAAILRSYGDNNIDGNADGSPAPPTIAKK
jgi:hypothetical protein